MRTVEMHSTSYRKLVSDEEFHIVALTQLQCGRWELAIGEDHLPGGACRRPFFPSKGDLEAHGVFKLLIKVPRVGSHAQKQ